MPFPFSSRSSLLIGCLVLFFIIFACKSVGKKEQPAANAPATFKNKPSAQMPTTALPTSMGDYADDWKIVDSLQAQGLFKSALDKTEEIYARARRDKNSPQAVKTLIFRGKFATMLEEDGLVKAIQMFEKELPVAGNRIERSVLQSLLGQLYHAYLESQGWKLNQRTPIPDGEGGDILTWSAAQIEKVALRLFSASIAEPAALLKETQVGIFKDLLTEGLRDSVAGRALRPSLYDLLCHRALAHFANGRSFLTEPAYAFKFDQAEAFAPRTDFIRAKFDTQDSTSGVWLAIQTYQQVLNRMGLSMNVSSGGEKPKYAIDTAAAVSADLLRLQFAYQNSVRDDKVERYRIALDHLLRQYADHPMGSEVAFQLAKFYYELEKDKAANAQKAVALCEEAIRNHPGAYGAVQCNSLLKQIRAVYVGITVEEVNLPDKPVLVSVNYRNLKKLWVKVLRDDWEQSTLRENNFIQLFEWLNAQRPLQSKTWDVQDPGDYQAHRTEIALEALPFGSYWIFVSKTPDFNQNDALTQAFRFTVSNIAAFHYTQKGETHYVLAHRQTGAPLSGVKLDFFRLDYSTGTPRRVGVASVLSDRDGFVKPKLAENQEIAVLASLGKDSLRLNRFYTHRYRSTNPSQNKVRFFTDRKLYRPGQTVYFKGVVFSQNRAYDGQENAPKILPNQSVTVSFYDANGQEKNQVKLKSNEFGTFNGTFTAPAGGLMGGMSIRASEGAEGTEFFRVEEYKRPRFEVKMKPVEGAFRLDDKIVVRGEAKNYAGNAVDGAQVKYRVVRRARFPFWDSFRSWSRPWYFDSPEMEIANGKVSSAADGSFSIEFTAIPDPTVPKKDQPVFDYQITVDVTDITGETRNALSNVSAAYAALQVEWDLSNNMALDSLRSIGLRTKNMAGQKQAAEGQITLQRLAAPAQFFKKRYWERPDLPVMAKADFERMFPDYAWKNEDDPENWRREDFIHAVAFNTAEAENFSLSGQGLQAGWYLAKLQTKDAFGTPVEMQKYVRVYANGQVSEEPFAKNTRNSHAPGETAQFNFGGKPSDLHFFFAQESDGVMQKPEWVSAHIKNLSTVDVPVRENNRGGMVLHWFCFKDNRVYGGEPINIAVPWDNKELKITYETFRDKLLPGQKEEWRIKISGPKKEKVAAEIVAAMYDASLDYFSPHSWHSIAFPTYHPKMHLQTSWGFGVSNGFGGSDFEVQDYGPERVFPDINWFDFPFWANGRYATTRFDFDMSDNMSASGRIGGNMPVRAQMKAMRAELAFAHDLNPEARYDIEAAEQAPAPPAQSPPAQVRRNLNETVFFFPELHTDAEGNVILKFTMNEALTRWKLLAYAHTKDLQQVVSEKEIVTQKELMVIANPPRFLRQGDEIEFSAKVSNLSQAQIEGTATLGLYDAATMTLLEREFGLVTNKRVARFSILPGQSSALSWRVKVPETYMGAVTWQIVAEAGSFRDGEESSVPVVSNRMLVTETLPISLRGMQSKTFSFENLKNAAESSTLRTHNFSLEFSSNPVWYAVQALPYLMEFPHECSEQVFSRFYANTLAASVTEKLPQVKRVYERWKGTGALKSNLSKNQELKSALLEETPWVLDAQSEEQQKQNIALLFDLNRMADERERALHTLSQRQLDNGAWPWFAGGPDSWYITQHILNGFSHLQRLNAFDLRKDQRSAGMLEKALNYCSGKLNEQYAKLEREAQANKIKLDDDHLDGMAIQYLYAAAPANGEIRPSREVAYYLGQAEKYWLGKGLYQEGMIALALHRWGRKESAAKIVASLKERATVKEELGMFWPVDWGYRWYELPVETQALMVEVFSEVANDAKAVEELRIWLLKNKQTNRWESTKATAEAVYALLLNGSNWLDNTRPVQVSLGGNPVKVNEYEAGTGYFKQSWSGSEVKKSWADIRVDNPNANIAWGAAYWQYFEDLDKIQDFQKTPLSIVKQLFLEENTPTGPVLKPIAEGQTLKRGDRIKVRIEIRVDRAMEFVHLKDMRAAGFEPLNVLSSYRWQGGLGYYESTKDLATHFFIDYLPSGTFVFEYPVVVSLRGDMSNGITTMQCMYAPEFSSHSRGLRVKVE